MNPWRWTLIFLSIWTGQNFGCEPENQLPQNLRQLCICRTSKILVCKGIKNSAVFHTSKSRNDISMVSNSNTNPFQLTEKLFIEDSPTLDCLNPKDFVGFQSLNSLSVISSGLKTLNCHNNQENKKQNSKNGGSSGFFKNQLLHHLDLSNNSISDLIMDDLTRLGSTQLRTLNVSHNKIDHIESRLFAQFTQLISLDLSNNHLNENLKPSVFENLPRGLKYLDISNNKWECSPKLVWMHKWKSEMPQADQIFQNIDKTKCWYVEKSSNLFEVMKYYDQNVLPQCPLHLGCSCLIKNIININHYKTTENTDIIDLNHGIPDDISPYIVQVLCTGKNLTKLPNLPEYTKEVDLSENQIKDDAFDELDIKKYHYDNVQSLSISGNQLENLSVKLLKMKLNIKLSAKNNQLSSISYDLSQYLINKPQDFYLELSNNPWKCYCNSGINDVNLLKIVADKRDLKCGPDSDFELNETLFGEIKQAVLCPPVSNGENQELLLRLLCVLLGILILTVFTKLVYDYRVFKSRGQLPWLALKMPNFKF